MATIRKRGDRWQAIIRRTDLQATRTFDRKTDAAAWARALERDADLGGTMPARTPGTFSELIRRYEREVYPLKRWGHTKARELRTLDRDLGGRLLAGMTRATWLDYVAGLDLSPAGRGMRLSYAREVMRTASELWAMPVPLADLSAAIGAARRNRITGRSGARSRRATPDELERICAYAESRQRSFVDLAAIVRVLAVQPFRVGELLGLQWDDLRPDARAVVVRARKHPDVSVREGRVDHVPLIRFAGVDVWELVSSRPRYLPAPYPYNLNTVTTAFRSACAAVDVRGLRLHDLRAYSISRLAEAGVPLPQVALLSGHTSYKTLARHYARLDPAAVHASMATLDRAAHRAGLEEPAHAVDPVQPAAAAHQHERR